MTTDDDVAERGELAHAVDDSVFIQNLLDASNEVIYFKDLQSRFLRASLGCAQLHRRTQEEMVGLSDADLFSDGHAQAALADEQRIIATGQPVLNKEEREQWHDRPDTWVASSKFPLRGPDGTIVGTFGISREITRRVTAEQELRRVEAQLRAVLEGSTDEITMYDAELRYRYLNPAAERVRGVRAEDVIGKRDRDCGMSQALLPTWEAALERVIATGERGQVEFERRDESGRAMWFHTTFAPDLGIQGTVIGVLASTRDITTMKVAEVALAHQATHDSLTGLANRALITDRLDAALACAGRRPGYLAVLFVDIDRFKDINDTFGHKTGDSVLIEVARRLTSAARRDDMVARLAGDEFVVICESVPTQDRVAQIARRIVRAVSAPFVEGNVRIGLSASVGVALAEDSSVSPTTLLSRADAAMYRVKYGGRNGFRISDTDTDVLPGTQELENALAEGSFRVVYQPLLSFEDRKVLGVEALLRWSHPERGLLTPDQFLVAAERTGVIRPLGEWVLNQACSDLARWIAELGDQKAPTFVSVNVTAAELTATGFGTTVVRAVEGARIEPGRLRLEISEQTLVSDAQAIAPVLRNLSDLGVELAVDNFGATAASIARLPRLPVSVVKLDRFTDIERHRQVVAAVVAMAHALGMTVVAGGIETGSLADELDVLSFDGGQGYLFGGPMDADAVARHLSAAAPGPAGDHTG